MVITVPMVRFKNRSYILTLMQCRKIDNLLQEMLSSATITSKPKEARILGEDIRTVARFRKKQFGPCLLTEMALEIAEDVTNPVVGKPPEKPDVLGIVAEMEERAIRNNLIPDQDKRD